MSTQVTMCHLSCINTALCTAFHLPRRICLEQGNLPNEHKCIEALFVLELTHTHWHQNWAQKVSVCISPSVSPLSEIFKTLCLFMLKLQLCHLFKDSGQTARGGNTSLDHSLGCSVFVIGTAILFE